MPPARHSSRAERSAQEENTEIHIVEMPVDGSIINGTGSNGATNFGWCEFRTWVGCPLWCRYLVLASLRVGQLGKAINWEASG